MKNCFISKTKSLVSKQKQMKQQRQLKYKLVMLA